MRSNPRPCAFTLIELLVVITVIGVLVATLLPALSKVRESANRAKCMAGARGVGLACDLYCNDSREYYPEGGFSAAYAPFEPPWHEKLVQAQYVAQAGFTNKGGCPYGPDIYYDYAGNENYNGCISLGWPFCTTSYGLNPIIQSGYGLAQTGPFGTMTTYGVLRRSGKLATNHGNELAVVICSIASWRQDYINPLIPWVTLYATLGDPPQYSAGDMFTRTPRHNREGLPMSLADGHTVFVPTEVVKTYPWSMSYGRGLMDVSFAFLDSSGQYGLMP